jgi:hypothetical protein
VPGRSAMGVSDTAEIQGNQNPKDDDSREAHEFHWDTCRGEFQKPFVSGVLFQDTPPPDQGMRISENLAKIGDSPRQFAGTALAKSRGVGFPVDPFNRAGTRIATT